MRLLFQEIIVCFPISVNTVDKNRLYSECHSIVNGGQIEPLWLIDHIPLYLYPHMRLLLLLLGVLTSGAVAGLCFLCFCDNV